VIARFRGIAAATHEDLHVFREIDAAIQKLLDCERPAGVILDFRELEYSWGDEMGRTLSITDPSTGGQMPLVIVVSDLNRAGMTSLLRDELSLEPAEFLVSSEDEAYHLIEPQLKL
jgi:hypothetical protein